MNEFLKNLRREQEKRSERNRRPYNNPQYGSFDAQNNPNRYKGVQRKPHLSDAFQNLLNENLPALKTLLENIADQQKELLEVGERRATAEERKADAMEKIAANLKNWSETIPPIYSKTKQFQIIENDDVTFHQNQIPVFKPDQKEKEKIINIITAMREKGCTYERIALHLNGENFRTFSGKGKWHGQTVNKIYQQHFEIEDQQHNKSVSE